MPVFVPVGEILFFVRQDKWMWRMQFMQEQFSEKESIQSLGDPDAACFMRTVSFTGG
jgi:hypothetical protein